MRTRTWPGKFVKKIVVYTNDPANEKTNVECRGSVLAAALLSPATAAFGRVARDAGPQHRKITLKPGDGGPISPKVLPINTPGIDAAITEVVPGAHYELDVTISPPWPNGRLRTAILLETGVKECPRYPVTVIAEIPLRIRVTPSMFQVAPSQRETESIVHLTWTDQTRHEIIEATVNDPELSAVFDHTPPRREGDTQGTGQLHAQVRSSEGHGPHE
ncbi:MAG: hypothetical protein ABII12_08830 [Planctomycetota bacterium]